MSEVFSWICGGSPFFRGSLKSYPQDVLYEEISFLAYYFHWSHNEITHLTHRDRIKFCGEVSKINTKMNGERNKPNIFNQV